MGRGGIGSCGWGCRGCDDDVRILGIGMCKKSTIIGIATGVLLIQFSHTNI